MEVTVDQIHLFPSHGHTAAYKTVVLYMPGGRVLPNPEGMQDLRTCYCVRTDAEVLPSTPPVVVLLLPVLYHLMLFISAYDTAHTRMYAALQCASTTQVSTASTTHQCMKNRFNIPSQQACKVTLRPPG